MPALPGAIANTDLLLEQIGEGGCTRVYVAEQKEPVRRKVAQGIMDTKQVVARFEADRQVLAMMDHPNIARCSMPGCPPYLNAPRRITEALERLVQLYDAWGKPAQATEWKQKLAAFQQANKVSNNKSNTP